MRFAGFTLIELLIVISIIALMTVVGVVNMKDFAASQVAEKGAGQVQTMLRLAQSNATTSALCDNNLATSWFVEFTADNKLKLHCNWKDSSNVTQDVVSRTYTLENVNILMKCNPTPSDCPSQNTSTTLTFSSLKVSFSPLYGQASFEGYDTCIRNAAKMMIVVKHASKENYKCANISKTGVVDVQ